MRSPRDILNILIITLLFTTPITSFALDTHIIAPGWLSGIALPDGIIIKAGPRIVINIAARKLRLIENEEVVATFDVAIGSTAHPSPVMNSAIQQLVWNPSWIPPPSPWAAGASVAPPGPRNPLGPVKMKLGNGIMVHGTNKPNSVGHAASHGCFRMRSDEAANLAWYIQERNSAKNDPLYRNRYEKNRYSTYWVSLDRSVPVSVVYEPVEVYNGTLHLYPDTYGKVGNWDARIRSALANAGYNTTDITPEHIASLSTKVRKGPVTVAVSEITSVTVAAN